MPFSKYFSSFSAAANALGDTIQAPYIEEATSSIGAAYLRLNTTVRSSGVVMSFKGNQMNEAPPRFFAASTDCFTAAAFIGSPSWNVTPWRRWKVHVFLSALDSHRSASTGVNLSDEPGGLTRSRGS